MRVLGSITNRIFLATTLLAMLSIGAAVYFVSSRVTAETEAELQSDLSEAASLVEVQQATQLDNISLRARLIADLPKFKAVVEIGDRPTLMPIEVWSGMDGMPSGPGTGATVPAQASYAMPWLGRSRYGPVMP